MAVEKENLKELELHDDIVPPSDFKAYDKAWLERYRKLSFWKGVYDAIASATFFGMFTIVAKMLFDKAGDPKKKLDNYDPKRTPRIMIGMMAFGVCFAYLSNKKEALIQQLTDNRLAHRIKAGEEENDHGEMQEAKEKPSLIKNMPTVTLDIPDGYWQNRTLKPVETQEKQVVNR